MIDDRLLMIDGGSFWEWHAKGNGSLSKASDLKVKGPNARRVVHGAHRADSAPHTWTVGLFLCRQHGVADIRSTNHQSDINHQSSILSSKPISTINRSSK
jgi:hypothetical protein